MGHHRSGTDGGGRRAQRCHPPVRDRRQGRDRRAPAWRARAAARRGRRGERAVVRPAAQLPRPCPQRQAGLHRVRRQDAGGDRDGARRTISTRLARVKGVGPAKLEQYGDDVLSLVTEAVDA